MASELEYNTARLYVPRTFRLWPLCNSSVPVKKFQPRSIIVGGSRQNHRFVYLATGFDSASNTVLVSPVCIGIIKVARSNANASPAVPRNTFTGPATHGRTPQLPVALLGFTQLMPAKNFENSEIFAAIRELR